MPRADWARLAKYPISIPQLQLCARFNEIARPLIERIWSNIYETRSLSLVRDALLPKLLSGELRCKEAP